MAIHKRISSNFLVSGLRRIFLTQLNTIVCIFFDLNVDKDRMRIEKDIKLDFKDVMIKPKRSDAPSRSAIELKRTFKFLHSEREWTGLPICVANMDTVGTFDMARSLMKRGAVTALHKFYTVTQLIEFYRSLSPEETEFVFYTTGVKNEDLDKMCMVGKEVKLNNICVDVANGYTEFFVKRLNTIRSCFPNATIMAGNVATPEMVQELLLAGRVDIVKVGIGPGAACQTRLKTGVGVPQLSAIIECADAAHGLGGHICGDGGCRESGDVGKAFGAGADFVMLGSFFAGCDESSGDWRTDKDGNKFFKFYGMSSEEALNRYYGGVGSYRTPEGATIEVPHKGSALAVLQGITGGLVSTCTYVGAMRLKDLSKCTTFIQVVPD